MQITLGSSGQEEWNDVKGKLSSKRLQTVAAGTFKRPGLCRVAKFVCKEEREICEKWSTNMPSLSEVGEDLISKRHNSNSWHLLFKELQELK